MGDAVLVEITDGAAVLTLNRPAEGNRLGQQMLAALDGAATTLAEAEGLRAVLIRAEGRMFSVGGAIDEFTASGDIPAYLDGVLATGHRAMRTIASLGCPVVAAIQGPVAGAGIALALSADFVLASPAMVLRAGYPALGLTPDFGVSWLLTRLAGRRRAMDILVSNRPVSAEECHRLGLVGAVFDDVSLDTEARALHATLARGPTLALAGLKRLVREADTRDFWAQLDSERDLMVKVAESADAAEGVAAFLARRQPAFEGI